MSHWNLQVTIGNKDKEIMRGAVMLVAKWYLLTAKLDDGRNCHLRKGVGIIEDNSK